MTEEVFLKLLEGVLNNAGTPEKLYVLVEEAKGYICVRRLAQIFDHSLELVAEQDAALIIKVIKNL